MKRRDAGMVALLVLFANGTAPGLGFAQQSVDSGPSDAVNPASLPAAQAEPVSARPPRTETVGTARRKRLAAGYKIGNGLGYLGGDLDLAPLPHLDLDIQVNWFGEKYGASGFGVAPALRFSLFEGDQSTPYLSAGYLYFRLSFDSGARGSGDGAFANLGYEWKWRSGLGLLVGGGILFIRDVNSDDPRTTIIGATGVRPNLEFGLRYMLL